MKNRAVHFGVFTALALIFSYVETLIPFSPGIPGVKLGLANLVTVIALYKTTARETWLLSVTRVVLAGFLFGNMASILYSLAGGVFSLMAMWLLKRKETFSLMGVSVAGGVCHNLGQLVTAMLVMESLNLVYYVPVLLVSGLITGAVIGIVAHEMLKRLRTVQL